MMLSNWANSSGMQQLRLATGASNRGSLNKAEWDEPDSQGILLLNTVSSLYTSAMGLVLADGQHAMERLRVSRPPGDGPSPGPPAAGGTSR